MIAALLAPAAFAGAAPVPPDAGLPYETSSARAAAALQADIALMETVRVAVDRIYARDYAAAEVQLGALTRDHPATGIGPLGLALVWQARMFEEMDFRWEAEYRRDFTLAREQVSAGLARPGGDAFEHFVLAGALGLDAIHNVRRGELLTALGRAIDGMGHLERVRELAPAFVDVVVGDGLYLYWRTVVTRQSALLPDFPDRRAEGLAHLERAEREAFLLGPGASLAIAYSAMEEHDLTAALARCEKGRAAYPDNVINLITRGRVLSSMGRQAHALAAFDEVRARAPDNQRVHYHRGVTLTRLRRYAEAEAALRTYLAFPDPTPESRGQAWYQLGRVHDRQRQAESARAAYVRAVETSGHPLARQALARLENDR